MNTKVSLNITLFATVRAISCFRAMGTTVALMALFGMSTGKTLAQSPFAPKGQGTISLSPQNAAPFAFSGTELHLGQYRSYGEMQIRSNNGAGALEGVGIVVFEAANGDRLVGQVTMQTGANNVGQMTFAWRDFVVFSNGTIVSSSGSFEKTKPSGTTVPVKTHGVVIIAIIAILIG
jgi:hypothetical protein